jgi:hypothetical protein
MMEEFSIYRPATWYDDVGFFTIEEKPEKQGRMTSPWKVRLAGAVLGVSSMLFLVGASASTLDAYPLDARMTASRPESLGDINRSFGVLLEAFRSAKPLLTDDRTRQIAERAASRRNEKVVDIEAWAQKLAADVKDADD